MNDSNKNDKTPKIELLGIGSTKNRQLRTNLEIAMASLGVQAPIIEVKDIQKLLKYDIDGIPALVVDDRVIFEKVVPEIEDLKIVLNVLFNDAANLFQIKNILVPTDFSKEAENALKYALKLAKTLKAKVNLVHVYSSDVELRSFPLSGGALEPETKADVEVKLAQFAKNNSNGTAVYLKERYVRVGLVADELLQMSKLPQTDLIVIAAKGEVGGIGKWFGSVTSSVARKAECPVLVVPKGAQFNGINRIVYASNFHPSEEKTLPKIVYLSKQLGTSIHFVHIVQNRLNDYIVDSEWADKKFQFENAPFLMNSVECSDVGKGLDRFANEKQADLMVMTTGKRSFFEELFHKSMTQKMVYNTKIPLLIMHFEEH